MKYTLFEPLSHIKCEEGILHCLCGYMKWMTFDQLLTVFANSNRSNKSSKKKEVLTLWNFTLTSLCSSVCILCFQSLVFSGSAHPNLLHLPWLHHHQVPAGRVPASELRHSSSPDSSSETWVILVAPPRPGCLLSLSRCCIYSQHHVASSWQHFKCFCPSEWVSWEETYSQVC